MRWILFFGNYHLNMSIRAIRLTHQNISIKLFNLALPAHTRVHIRFDAAADPANKTAINKQVTTSGNQMPDPA